MSIRHWAACTALVIAAGTGCGAETPDYQSIWTTPGSTTPTTTETPVPVAQYLESVGVTGETVPPDKLTDLTVTVPTPPGWKPVNNPNFAPGTWAIAKGDGYPMAMLLVFKLNGDFDVAQAVQHGYADAELSKNFKRLHASTDSWRGFPSAMIEGSYDLHDRRMHSYNRIVFPTGSPPANQRYLVQLTVTGYAEKAFEESADIEAIIGGFKVEVPPAPKR
nr:LpqN/LpqT family lipoprotein [Mycobacterium sp. QGD 101]